ncbi:hypothetical protein BOX15_Mlig017627g3, partial [Macrostomum lignano]
LMSSSMQNIVWVDLEMTGLNLDRDKIMEMACLVTDKDLNVLAEAPTMVLHIESNLLNSMDKWCTEHHGKSGLTERCRASRTSLSEAQSAMLDFVRQYTVRGACPLAGNSIHVDAAFLRKYMPDFMAQLHYRIIDVSTVKELCKRWYPGLQAPAKLGSHRALADIQESIRELQFYRQQVFQPPN